MTKLGVRPEAEIDAFEAALWYESERSGLGIEFLDAVREAFRQIEGMPLLPQGLRGRPTRDASSLPVRRVLLRRGR